MKAQLEQILGTRVSSLTPLSGGDAAAAFKCATAEGESFFVKTVSSGNPFRMEARGLQLLRTEDGIRVPEVVGLTDTLLVQEWLTFGSPGRGFQEEMGRRLALTHQQCRRDVYGFEEDHILGKTPQKNLPQLPARPGTWAEFWWSHRLEPMLQRLQDPDLASLGRALEARLPELLGPVTEAPSLIHGDLWSGNTAADDQGHPVIFDPAPSYSHHEAELGMTKLFGGFTPAFYSAYHECFPLQEGWQDRQDLYMLYHVLNHAVLFGSAYRSQAHALLRRYV
jgi:fructosamine-3-kinase